jgi:serine phosphatase RsbU (regulator of sigma subunit)
VSRVHGRGHIYDPRVSGFDSLTRLLDAAEAAAPVDAVSALTREVGARLRASSASFLVADTSGRALVRLVHIPLDRHESQSDTWTREPGHRRQGEESARVLPFDGGPMEQVVRRQRPEVLPPEPRAGRGDWTVLAPVTERGEVIGVLELVLPGEPGKADTAEIASLAHLLAFVVIANRRHTDLFEWGHRSRPLSLSAEIQQRLLPGPRTCEAGAFTLAGWLEPAADIAGDTFDFSLERDFLHLSVTDAMGHGVAAALTATLCVSALRGSRRRGASLVDQAASADTAVAEHDLGGGLDDFVTGLVGRVDLGTGVLHLVNAGHVTPYLARLDEVSALALPPNLPFGIFGDTAYEAVELELQPHDRVVFVTDGMLERNAASIDLPTAIRASASLHPREAANALADSVLEATGHALTDDATVLCLDWYGGHGQDRATAAGADVTRASGPTSAEPTSDGVQVRARTAANGSGTSPGSNASTSSAA